MNHVGSFHGQKLGVHTAAHNDNDDEFLPDIDSFDSDEDMNISPALRALMAK
jgi:hypothetical protein